VAGEVLVELAGDVVVDAREARQSVEGPVGAEDAAGRAEDPRADGGGELFEHGVVAFELEGHPDEAGGGGGQQQRAGRAVHRAVGDVEQAVPVGLGGQPGPEPAKSVVSSKANVRSSRNLAVSRDVHDSSFW